MNSAPAYLIRRFIYRIFEFIRHWYVKSMRLYWHAVISQIEKLDYKLALRITLRHISEPLYGDYSIIGHILGFIFRSGRVIIASITYAIILVFALAIYIMWLLIPPVMVYGAVMGHAL